MKNPIPLSQCIVCDKNYIVNGRYPNSCSFDCVIKYYLIAIDVQSLLLEINQRSKVS